MQTFQDRNGISAQHPRLLSATMGLALAFAWIHLAEAGDSTTGNLDQQLRNTLAAQGFTVTQTGGDVLVVPTANPDQLALFQSGAVEGVWTVEPWVTRLEKDAKAKVFLEDKDCITTWLVSSVKFLKDHKDLAKKIVDANNELTQWIKAHPADAQQMLVAELKAETKTEVPADTVAHSLQRIELTTEVSPTLVQKAVKDGQDTGFIKGEANTARLIEKL